MRTLVILVSSLTLVVASTIPALAADSALTASPAILETILSTTEPTTTTISIQNNTNFPLPIKGSASAFLANETIPESSQATYNASRWFTLDPADFILQPLEVKQVTVTITPPPGAEPGGHYATLYFRPLIPEDAVSQNRTLSLARIGVLALLVVPGEIEEQLTLGQLSAPSWLSFGPLKYWSSLSNPGSVHLLPTSTLTVHNLFGRLVHTQTSDPTLVLPHTTKEHNFTWDLRYGFGPYTATLTTHYGTDHPALTTNSVTTWLIPWPLLLILFVLLTFIYKIFIVNRRRLALALRVLQGTYEPPETTQTNPRHYLESGSRPPPAQHSPQSRPRRPRRQSHRG